MDLVVNAGRAKCVRKTRVVAVRCFDPGAIAGGRFDAIRHHAAMGKEPVVLWRWWIMDERTGKRRLTTYKLTRADAAHRYPGADSDPQSREVRHLPAPGEVHGNTRPPIEARAVGEPQLSSCAFCEGSGWVCADHPALPWEHDNCGAEGSPCVCNPEGAVQWQHVYAEVPNDKPGH